MLHRLIHLALLSSLASSTVACKSSPQARRQTPPKTLESTSDPGAEPVDPALFAAAVAEAKTLAATSHAASMERAVGWQSLPEDVEWSEILDPDRSQDDSFSFGTVSRGVLLDSAELPLEGEAHSIIERHRKRQTRWGTSELVELIQAAALHVKLTEGGAPLRVGNLSRKKGGDIRWSSSHNSGRDADLAFFVIDATTFESVPAPDLLRFDDQGIPEGREDLRFDVKRNWRLTEALLSQDEVNIQWLFISLGLKKLLLDYARETGADPDVIRRAESVLHQPTDAPPHADHFHLRIGCSPEDRLDGCLDWGPQWDWADWHRDALLSRSLELAETFEQDKREPKTKALDFLADIRSPFAADIAAAYGLWDEDAEVRDKAMDVAYSQYAWTANALLQVQKYVQTTEELPSQHLRQAYNIQRRSRDPLAKEFALERLSDTAVAVPERRLAADSLSHFMESDLVPILLEHLANQPPPVRAEIARVLRRITNRTSGVDWAAADDAAVARALEAWRNWWAVNRNRPRDAWLADGFTAAGVEMDTAPQPKHIDGLLALLESGEPHLVYNANRTVRELTGRWAPLEQDDGAKLHDYWEDWWAKNRERVISGDLGDES